jgi:PhnB protein
MAVKSIPQGHSTLTPYITVRDSNKAIEFYKKAFGAVPGYIMRGPDGKVGHVELTIGNSKLMMSDEMAQGGCKAPDTLHGTTGSLMMYVEDVDSAFERAVQAGAKAHMQPADMFWGDRFGRVEDPFGHYWGIATHKEDLTDAEIDRRAKEFFSNMTKQAGGGHA